MSHVFWDGGEHFTKWLFGQESTMQQRVFVFELYYQIYLDNGFYPIVTTRPSPASFEIDLVNSSKDIRKCDAAAGD